MIEDHKNSQGGGDKTQETLSRIAKLLDCSVDNLTSHVGPPPNLRGAAELLTIWVELDGDEHRDTLLTFARQLTASR